MCFHRKTLCKKAKVRNIYPHIFHLLFLRLRLGFGLGLRLGLVLELGFEFKLDLGQN